MKPNVDFKLHAPGKTVVQGRVENGKVIDLEVTPKPMIKARQSIAFGLIILIALLVSATPGLLRGQETPSGTPGVWMFVSIPDFLNFDIEYPQKGWEDALGYVLESMKKENPAFAMVAGDLVMGKWGTLNRAERTSPSSPRSSCRMTEARGGAFKCLMKTIKGKKYEDK